MRFYYYKNRATNRCSTNVFFAAFSSACLLGGCFAPSDRLEFPSAPVEIHDNSRSYDVDANGLVDFLIGYSLQGRIETLHYDDDEDGTYDRVYRLDDYAADRVPHLIILLDSIPFNSIASYYEEGGLRVFAPPQKVIPPFPTMSGVIFTDLLHSPPLPGANNRSYDRRTNAIDNRIVKRAFGDKNPWEMRLHYRTNYWENGWTFLQPKAWYSAELKRVKTALDESPDRITLAYVASTAGLLSRYGRDGLDEIFTQLETLCLQLLYERRGAIVISILSDHGHNLQPAQRISLDDTLKAAGFRISNRIQHNHDIVYDMDGLVNYLGIHTRKAAAVADAVVVRKEVELVMYQQGREIIIRDENGYATVAARNGRSRYKVETSDVFDYKPHLAQFESSGLIDEDGFVADDDWFIATVNHRWPDAPRRVWRAFHGLTVNPPQVMLTFRDGYCTGLSSLDMFIDMASTHGGLDQDDSAAFVMTMTERVNKPLRSENVMLTIEPLYDPNNKPNE